MSAKTQNANVNSASDEHVFTVGQMVMVSNTKTDDEPTLGKITAIAKGWYNVETEEFGNVSARIRSLTLASQEDIDEDIDEETNDEIESDVEPETDDETVSSRMAAALKAARVRYAKTHRPDGTPSADCADVIAKELRDLEPLEVAALADRCLQVAKGTHEAKYGHLNPGQIRMNSGNRIRAAWRTAFEEDDTVTIQHLKFVLGLDDDEDEDCAE